MELNEADKRQLKKQISKRCNEFGKYLYHYTSLPAFINMIKTHEIWLSNSGGMNDVKETRFFVECIEEQLKDYGRSNFFKCIYEDIENNYQYVLSLSTERDDAAQWERYADAAQGVCIVFDVEELVKCLYGYSNFMFNRVYYNDDVTNSLYYKIIKEYFETGRISTYSSEKALIASLLDAANLQKHPSFKHECEIRITTKEKSGQNGISVDIKELGGVVKKVVVLKLDMMGAKLGSSFEKTINSVILGPKTRQNILVLKEYLSSNNIKGLLDAVFQSNCPLR